MEKTGLCYEYVDLLRDYLESPEELDLYNASLLGKEFIRKGIGPEDIIEMHYKSIRKILEDICPADEKEAFLKSFRVLLEVMSPYDMAFGHYFELKRMNLLQEVGMRLISFLDLDSLCRFIVDQTSEIFKAEVGCLYLKDRATGELTLKAAGSIQVQDLEGISENSLPIRIPLQADSGLVGEIRLAGRKGSSALDEAEKQMDSILANQFALALERLKLYKNLEEQSIKDGLTGVYNARYFFEAMGKEIQRARRYRRALSLLIIDVDNFKEVNDCYGHLAGDAVIKGVAMFLKGAARQTDVAARYGGDEFAVLMPDTDKKQALNLADRLLDKVRNHSFEVYADRIGVTLSAGAADYNEEDTDESDLVKRADQALYRAKAEGKDRVCWYD